MESKNIVHRINTVMNKHEIFYNFISTNQHENEIVGALVLYFT